MINAIEELSCQRHALWSRTWLVLAMRLSRFRPCLLKSSQAIFIKYEKHVNIWKRLPMPRNIHVAETWNWWCAAVVISTLNCAYLWNGGEIPCYLRQVVLSALSTADHWLDGPCYLFRLSCVIFGSFRNSKGRAYFPCSWECLMWGIIIRIFPWGLLELYYHMKGIVNIPCITWT